MTDRTSNQQLYRCPDCKNLFVQPFVCTTCGAQKLYDETVRSQAAAIESAKRIMQRAISWLQIKEAAFATAKGPAIIEAMQRFVGDLPDETEAPLTISALDALIAEADKYVLPVDVRIGAGTFRKGIKVGTMLRGLRSHAEKQIATAYEDGPCTTCKGTGWDRDLEKPCDCQAAERLSIGVKPL